MDFTFKLKYICAHLPQTSVTSIHKLVNNLFLEVCISQLQCNDRKNELVEIVVLGKYSAEKEGVC